MKLERKVRRLIAKKSGTLKRGKAPGTFGRHVLWQHSRIAGLEYHATKGYRLYRP